MTPHLYIHCVFLPVTNLKRSIHWYSTTFGFRLLWVNGNFASSCLDPSGAKLTMARVENVAPLQFDHHGKPHPILTLGTPDIQSFHHSLLEAGASPSPIMSFHDGHTCFIVRDPDDHPVYISRITAHEHS
ncbi:VOC family protein [Paenibacillus tarimensis]|uniref:VOC family protein n=1 Tax=Paenibacillus tarimensis TaxID=416012 RepID=UPI001F28E6E8|nr:VOC family protein [Paenibacillus tarimensis]MCF2945178.1 VOC family protein [Paenibacillus tarimensis]